MTTTVIQQLKALLHPEQLLLRSEQLPIIVGGGVIGGISGQDGQVAAAALAVLAS